MKRLFGLVLLAVVSTACGGSKAVATKPDTLATVNEEGDLIGLINRKALEKDFGWFSHGYDEYVVDTETMNTLKPYLSGVNVKVYMGTWCSDSQREVPNFFKAMDAVGFKDITVIGVTTEKTTSDGLEKKDKVFNVPTFIFEKDGKEINRMVEYPLESLEKDMFAIFTTDTYKNPYADF